MKYLLTALCAIAFCTLSFAQVDYSFAQNGKTISDVKEHYKSRYDEVVYEKETKDEYVDDNGELKKFTYLDYRIKKSGLPLKYTFDQKTGVCSISEIGMFNTEKQAVIAFFDSKQKRTKKDTYGWVFESVIIACMPAPNAENYFSLWIIGEDPFLH